MYFDDIFCRIEKMPQTTECNIIDKYIETNIAHPFMEGNGKGDKERRVYFDVKAKVHLKEYIENKVMIMPHYLLH